MADILLCSTCGKPNEVSSPTCASCGAPLSVEDAEAEMVERYQQKEFRWSWVFIGFFINLAFLCGGAFGLPLTGMGKFGLFGLGLLLPFLLGGFFTALISPRKTFAEPALAALFAIIVLMVGIFLGLFYQIEQARSGLEIINSIRLMWTREAFKAGADLWSGVFGPSLITLAFVGPMGFLLARIGAWFGEKAQGTTRVPKRG
jgi:hypothetical protein